MEDERYLECGCRVSVSDSVECEAQCQYRRVYVLAELKSMMTTRASEEPEEFSKQNNLNINSL